MIVAEANQTQLKELYKTAVQSTSYGGRRLWYLVQDSSAFDGYDLLHVEHDGDYGKGDYIIVRGRYSKYNNNEGVIELERELQTATRILGLFRGLPGGAIPRVLPDEWIFYHLDVYMGEVRVRVAEKKMRGVSNRYIHQELVDELLNAIKKSGIERIHEKAKIRLIEPWEISRLKSALDDIIFHEEIHLC